MFYACTTRHSIMLVRQQRLRRDVWDETLSCFDVAQGFKRALLDTLSSSAR